MMYLVLFIIFIVAGILAGIANDYESSCYTDNERPELSKNYWNYAGFLWIVSPIIVFIISDWKVAVTAIVMSFFVILPTMIIASSIHRRRRIKVCGFDKKGTK